MRAAYGVTRQVRRASKLDGVYPGEVFDRLQNCSLFFHEPFRLADFFKFHDLYLSSDCLIRQKSSSDI